MLLTLSNHIPDFLSKIQVKMETISDRTELFIILQNTRMVI